MRWFPSASCDYVLLCRPHYFASFLSYSFDSSSIAPPRLSQAARWSAERKAQKSQEDAEDAQLEEDKESERLARAEAERKRAIRQAEADAPGTNGYRRERRERRSRSRSRSRKRRRLLSDPQGLEEKLSGSRSSGGRRQLLAKSRPSVALPPPLRKRGHGMLDGSEGLPTRGGVLGLHLRLADCYTTADPANKNKQRGSMALINGNINGNGNSFNGCSGTKGLLPEHVPLVVRAATRLITDGAVPPPAAIFVASNFAGVFKLLPRELWHAHGVTRLFNWADLQGRLGGEFRDHNVVALEQEILRFAVGAIQNKTVVP